MIKKKGQVFLYIILGILIVIFIFFGVYIIDYEDRYADSDEFSDFVYSCIEDVGIKSIYFNFLQGGYYDVPEPKHSYRSIEVPVYWELGRKNIPNKEIIQRELMKTFNENFPKCLADFKNFRDRGYIINENGFSGTAEISENKLNFKIQYPISIINGDKKTFYKDFEKSIDIDILSKLEIANKIIDEQSKKPDSLPLGFITGLAFENNFVYQTLMIDENTVMINLIFEDEDDFIYAFSSKFNWSENE